jgi:hypothetical protein
MIPANHFPAQGAAVADWKPLVFWRPLAARVLIVARTRIEGAWCAYIDAVPGHDHRHEYEAVLETGAKLEETLARVLFPWFDEIPYAR